MKLRTRKFLAGLLSFGMLLQAASPLSALATEEAPVAAAHKLTVTTSYGTYDLTVDENNNVKADGWLQAYPTVTYDDGFVFTGYFPSGVTIKGDEDVTINGVSGNYAVYGDLTADVNNLTVTKGSSYGDTVAAIQGNATINCTGDVKISGSLNYDDISLVNQAVKGELTVSNAQDVSIDGILNGGADITCQTLSLNCGNGSTVRGTLTVRHAEKIQATAYAIYGVIGDRGAEGNLVLDNCTGAVTLCNTYGYRAIKEGTVTVKNLPDGYVARYYKGSSEADSTETEDADDCARYSYFRIEYVNPSNKTLTLVNAKAYKDAEYTTELINATSANGTSTYHVEEGKTVYVKAEKPDEDSQWKFKGWTGSNETSEEIAVIVNEDMTLTANWAGQTTHTLTLTGAKAYSDANRTNELTPKSSEGNVNTYTDIEEGTQIWLEAVAPSDLPGLTTYLWGVFDEWMPGDGSTSFDYADGSTKTSAKASIIMPEGDVSLTSQWVTIYSVLVTGGTVNHLSGSDSQVSPYQFRVGDEIRIYPKQVEGKQAESLTVTQLTDTGTEVSSKTIDASEMKGVNDPYFEFTMPNNPVKVTVNFEDVKTTHTLTLKNAEAYDGETKLDGTAGEDGAVDYEVEDGKELTIKAVAPSEGQWKFDGWTGSDETSEEIDVTVDKNMTLTANWVEKVPEPDEEVKYGITVTMGNGEAIEVTNKNCENILGNTYTNGTLVYDPESHTLTGKGSFGKLKIEVTSDDKVDVELSSTADETVVKGSLTVTGAQNVEVKGASSAPLIWNDANITCNGDILMENTGSGNVLGEYQHGHGNLNVKSAQKVTIHGVGQDGTEEDDDNYTIYGKANIECSGDVEITSQNGGAIWDPIVITDAANVTITAAQRAIWDSRYEEDSSIKCSGAVKITSDTTTALYNGNLTVTGATDVTISGNTSSSTVGGDVTITCSGDVVLENKGTGNTAHNLTYTQYPTKGYEVKNGENAGNATVAYTDKEGSLTYNATSDVLESQYISITAVSSTPDVPEVPADDDISGDSTGGAIAAVIVGGAAILGGYEITTRVILHNILPEGADIPTNRGQLAMLMWQNADKPEPAAQPVFTDVADAELAQAAQWCVEQGYMTAEDGKFDPNGWTPKYRVIMTWNKAFSNK